MAAPWEPGAGGSRRRPAPGAKGFLFWFGKADTDHKTHQQKPRESMRVMSGSKPDARIA